MARITAQQKLERNMKRLADLFGIEPVKASIGTCGRMKLGLYFRPGTGVRMVTNDEGKRRAEPNPDAHIVIDHSMSFRKSLETQLHEFAHHLDWLTGQYVDGKSMPEPPASLPEVRAKAIGERYRHRDLQYWGETEEPDLKSWW